MVAAEAVGHDLIPDSVAYPRGRCDDVRRIEPRVLEELLGDRIHLLLGAELVFKQGVGLAVRFQLEIIHQPLVARTHLRGIDDLKGKLTRKRHFFALAEPLALAVQLVDKRILPDDISRVNIPVRPEIDNDIFPVG